MFYLVLYTCFAIIQVRASGTTLTARDMYLEHDSLMVFLPSRNSGKGDYVFQSGMRRSTDWDAFSDVVNTDLTIVEEIEDMHRESMYYDMHSASLDDHPKARRYLRRKGGFTFQHGQMSRPNPRRR